jgi:hypothetical protein
MISMRGWCRHQEYQVGQTGRSTTEIFQALKLEAFPRKGERLSLLMMKPLDLRLYLVSQKDIGP